MSQILLVLGLHFVADFVLQTDWMASNKSKSNKALLFHTAVYSIPFLLCLGWKYAAINMVLHTVIDYVSSRASSHYWQQGKTHEFFVVVGLDQYLHAVCLILTLRIL